MHFEESRYLISLSMNVRSHRQPYKGCISWGSPEKGLNERESEQRSSSGIDYRENPWFFGRRGALRGIYKIFRPYRWAAGPIGLQGGTKGLGPDKKPAYRDLYSCPEWS
jgi:hypothetical protein